jgi:hypothetical protein
VLWLWLCVPACIELVELISSSTAHSAARLPVGVVPRGALLEAAPGGGKTTVLDFIRSLVERHNRHLKQSSSEQSGRDSIPQLHDDACEIMQLTRGMQAQRVSSLLRVGNKCDHGRSDVVTRVRNRPLRLPSDLPHVTLLTMSGLDASVETDTDDGGWDKDGVCKLKTACACFSTCPSVSHCYWHH